MGGIGTTNTRIAPTIVIGMTSPRTNPAAVPASFALEVVGGIRSPPQSLVRRDRRSAHVLNFTRTRCPCLKRDRLRFRFGSGMEDHEFSYLDRSVIPWDVWRDDTADRRECPERITGLKGPDNVQKLRSNSGSACSGSASQEWIGLVVCPPLGQD